MSFEPKLNTLPDQQLALWPELAQVPETFVLYGGTALALRLGHRTSVDFDFFSSDPVHPADLQRKVSFLAGATVLQEEAGALTVLVNRGGPVKVSFFGPIGFGRIGVPDQALSGRLHVASLLDLAGTKVKALLQRVESKDYLDIAALLRAGIALEQILAAARTLFGDAFNPLVAQKTLSYFEGGDLEQIDPATRALLTRESLRDFELPLIPKAAQRLD